MTTPIGLEVSPALRSLLAAMRPENAEGRVLPTLTADVIKRARTRLMADHGAPSFDWQTLRSTCATYLTCSAGIYGAATVFLSARQLGHSVAIAERHYLGVHRGIPQDAKALEAAMGVAAEIRRIVAAGP